MRYHWGYLGESFGEVDIESRLGLWKIIFSILSE